VGKSGFFKNQKTVQISSTGNPEGFLTNKMRHNFMILNTKYKLSTELLLSYSQ